MAKIGSVMRKIAHGIFVMLLSSVTLAGILLVSLSLVITDRETVQSWPVRAGVYDNVTGNILELAAHGEGEQEGQGGDGNNQLAGLLNSDTLDSAAIREAIGGVYTPQYWQNKFNTLTDSTYDWLEGQQAEWQFELNFSDKTDELASALAAELAQQLAELPTCSRGEIPNQFDILNAACMPPGVTPAQAANQLERQLTSGDGPFGQDLRVNSQEISDETKANLRNVHDAATSLPTILTIVVLVLTALVAITGRTWLYGLRRAGLTLMGAGILSWIGFFIFKQVGNINPSFDDPATKKVTEELMVPLFKVASESVANSGLWTALAIVIFGGLLWLSAYTWHKIHHHAEAEAIAQRAMAGRQHTDATLPKPIDPEAERNL